jgi:hypothetical protein
MARPTFRLTCCLCRKPIAKAKNVWALDREWQRRFPTMVGTLACQACALRHEWRCEWQDGQPPAGHVAVAGQEGRPYCDSWDHVLSGGTQTAEVLVNVRSGLLQGAEEYLRWSAQYRGADASRAAELKLILAEWESAGTR